MQKRVLITGASRGIGKAIAIKLAEEGYDIVIHCRSNIALANEVKTQVESFGVNAKTMQFDICDREAAQKELLTDIEANGAYYGVVCNAGITEDGAFPALSGDDWDKVIRTNLDGFYNVVHPVVMPMVRRKSPGRIITLSSVSGMMGNRGQVNYSAAKAGIIGATKALAIELAKRKITVNCVAPGLIDTDMTDSIELQEALKMIPMQRSGKTEEVSSLISYLMSESAGYITRQVIAVNGGMF